MSANVNNQYDFFKKVNLDANGNLGISMPQPFAFTADNYTALLALTGMKDGDLAYVTNAQGTQWLPGTIGGNYYPNGIYIYATGTWTSDRNAISYQLELLVGNDEIVVNDPEIDLIIVGGKYMLEDGKKYRAGQNFTLSRPFNIDNITTGSVFDFQDSTIVYAGTGTMFQGTNTGTFRIKQAVFVATAEQTAMNTFGNQAFPASVMIIDDCGYLNFGSLGSIANYSAVNIDLIAFGTTVGTEGFIMSNIGNVTVDGSTRSNFVVDSNSPLFHFNGSFNTIQLRGSLPLTQNNESFVSYSPDFSHTGVVVTQGNAFDDSLGGTFFDEGHNGTITTFTNAGGGKTTVTTSAPHGITIQQKVVITGTTNYNGTFTITNVTGSSFDIDIAFVANDATGTFDTGDSNQFFNTNNMPFTTNGDQQDSKPVCKIISVAPITIPIVTLGVPENITGIDTDWTGEILDFFTLNADGSGTARYTGDSTASFRLSARITVAPVAKLLTAYIAVNNVTQTSSRWTADAQKTTTYNPEDIITLSPGDYVHLQIANEEGTQNVTGVFCNINVIPA
tara:strand:+ start:3649 stop:5331 length:1683 start_codon:yes stop_codon:yes gene_type:complete